MALLLAYVLFSSNSAATLELYSKCQGRALVCSRPAAANSLLFTLGFIHLKIFDMCFDCASSQNRWAWWARAGAFLDSTLVVVPCGCLDLVMTFRGACKGTLVLWWSIVDFSRQAVYMDAQSSWQARRFVDIGGLRHGTLSLLSEIYVRFF